MTTRAGGTICAYCIDPNTGSVYSSTFKTITSNTVACTAVVEMVVYPFSPIVNEFLIPVQPTRRGPIIHRPT
jgi:hypothetical protein